MFTKTTAGIACRFAEEHKGEWGFVGITSRVQECRNEKGDLIAYRDDSGFHIKSPLSNPF